MQFLQYAQSLNPVVLQIPLAGHFTPYDSYARTVTVTSNCKFTSDTRQGYGVTASAAAYYIAHGAEQFSDNLTWFLYYPEYLLDISAIQYLALKRDAVNPYDWFFGMLSGGALKIWNKDGTFSQTAASFDGSKSIAIRATSGVDIDFFGDGLFVEQEASLNFLSTAGDPIYIGCWPTGGAQCYSPLGIFAMFTSALTDAQIANLHTLAERMIVGHQPKTIYSLLRPDTQGAVIDLINAELTDLSGNGLNGTLSGAVPTISNHSRKWWSFSEASLGKIDIPNNSVWHSKNYNVYTMLCNFYASSNGRVFYKDPSFSQNISVSPADNITINQVYSGGTASYTINPTQSVFGSPMILQAVVPRNDPTESHIAYVNGADVSPYSTFSATTGTVTVDSGDIIRLGNIVSWAQVNANISQFKMHVENLSSSTLFNIYKEIALKHVIRPTPRFEYPITTSAVTAPGHCGPWSTHSGSHEWLDDGSQRYIKTSSIQGYMSVPKNEAYGAIYFKVYRAASEFGIQFNANVPDELYNGANQTGYLLYAPVADMSLALYRTNGGGVTALDGTAASYLPSTGEIEFFITRNLFNGAFKVYTRESVHSTWNLALEATDNTYTTCNHFLFYTVSALEFRGYNLMLWPYGDSLTPNDIPGLED